MELEQLLNELKKSVSELESLIDSAAIKTGKECAIQYVKDNGLEYIQDEALEAFHAGFLVCYRKYKNGDFDKKDGQNDSKSTCC